MDLILEIDANRVFKVGETGVLDFRITNRDAAPIPSIVFSVACPCELNRHKNKTERNVPVSSDSAPRSRQVRFPFDPSRAGEALLEIELSCTGQDKRPCVLRGQTSVLISSAGERAPSTSFHIDIHDNERFMGNDLSGFVNMASQARPDADAWVRERMHRPEPFWMRVDLELDVEAGARLGEAVRQIVHVDGLPPRSQRAILESLEPARQRRVYICSLQEVRFGRSQDNDVVLRFLPDFSADERSRTISAEQFIVRQNGDQFFLSPAPNAHAPMAVDGGLLSPGDRVPLTGGARLSVGRSRFELEVACHYRPEDPHWIRSLEEIRRLDPGEDPLELSSFDCLQFSRVTNGTEEEYWLVPRKVEIGWEEGAAAGFPRILSDGARAAQGRISYRKGRYYLEPLGLEKVAVEGHRLGSGEIACLGPDCRIFLGSSVLRWRLDPGNWGRTTISHSQ
jgi:hypothetical protein